jgi:flagellar hook protein FlgE
MQIFDSLGTAHTLTLGFLKTTAANQWQMEAYIQPGTDLNAASHATGNATGRVVMRGIVAFNSNGSFDMTTTALLDQAGAAITESPSTGNLTGAVVTWTNGASAQNVAFNFGPANSTSNLTQFDGASALFGTTINGSIYGALAGVEVSKTGVVTSKFDNGVNIDIFRLPIADFPNLNGLEGSSGNLYSQSTISGTLTLKDATQSGAGSVIASALEASTVDLAEEFSNMIVTQRAYSASTRIITTTDEMLNELVNIKR